MCTRCQEFSVLVDSGKDGAPVSVAGSGGLRGQQRKYFPGFVGHGVMLV